MVDKKYLQLTPDTQERIEYEKEDSIIHHYLKNKHWYQFGLGDILVAKQQNDDDGQWSPVYWTIKNKLLARWLVVFVDEEGLSWVRMIRPNGTLEQNIECIALDAWSEVRYEICPDYQDHLIFNNGEPYSLVYENTEEKQRISAVKRFNKKYAVNLKTIAETNNYIRSIGSQDSIWINPSKNRRIIKDADSIQVDIESIRHRRCTSSDKEKLKCGSRPKSIWYIKTKCGKTIDAIDIMGRDLYSIRPYSINETVKDM